MSDRLTDEVLSYWHTNARAHWIPAEILRALIEEVRASRAAPQTRDPLAPWYLADGSTVMLPAEEVATRRKIAARVLDAALRYVRAQDAFRRWALENPREEFAPAPMYEEDRAADNALAVAARAFEALGPVRAPASSPPEALPVVCGRPCAGGHWKLTPALGWACSTREGWRGRWTFCGKRTPSSWASAPTARSATTTRTFRTAASRAPWTRRRGDMIAWGPLEIARSPSWETWRATWHWQPAPRGVWMYRWALVSPWLTVRWVSRAFYRYIDSARDAPASSPPEARSPWVCARCGLNAPRMVWVDGVMVCEGCERAPSPSGAAAPGGAVEDKRA